MIEHYFLERSIHTVAFIAGGAELPVMNIFMAGSAAGVFQQVGF